MDSLTPALDAFGLNGVFKVKEKQHEGLATFYRRLGQSPARSWINLNLLDNFINGKIICRATSVFVWLKLIISGC